MNDKQAVFKQMIEVAKEMDAEALTVSGNLPEGWGFRVQVIKPETWKKITEREEKLEAE